MRLNRRIQLGTTVTISGYRCLVVMINQHRTAIKASPIEPTANIVGFDRFWRDKSQIQSFRNEFKSWLRDHKK